MSAGLGGSKGTSDTNSSSTENTNGSSTQTPNNLAALQTGWNAAGNVLGANNGVAETTAGTSSLLNGANTAQNLINTGGATSAGIASGGVTNGANQYLTPYANGSLVNNTNPDYQNVIHQFTDAAQAATDGNFAASGRYGSGANANAFNSAVANEAGQLGFQNYQQQQGNQLTAAQLLSGNYSTGAAQQLLGANQAVNAGTAALNPGTVLTAAGLAAPASYASTVATGNGGGTNTNASTTNKTGKQNTTTTNVNANVSV